MQKIIDGKRYDTEKAKLIAEDSWSYRSDFNHYEESLYLTTKGRWFLHGQGGPASKYAESVPGGGWTGGQAIRPLTEQEAFEWFCHHADPEDAAEHFSDLIEDA